MTGALFVSGFHVFNPIFLLRPKVGFVAQSRIPDMKYSPRFSKYPGYFEYSHISDISLPAALSIRGYENVVPSIFSDNHRQINDGTDWALVMLL